MNKITEKNNKSSNEIDTLSIDEILRTINNEDAKIHQKIEGVIPEISKLVEDVVISFNNQGKLFYLGCGSSGRLGVLDAVECPPTYSTPQNMVQGIIAGGNSALFESIENAEDSKEDAIDIINAKIKPNDVLIAISASGSAAYVIAALEQAKRINAKTCLITSNNLGKNKSIDHLIKLLVGPEIITGSTRMKAGTATKMVLNMISTAAMIKINKTYGNLMVDLKISNNKLKDRAIRIIQELTNLDYNLSKKLLKKANNNVKASIIMHKKDITYQKSLELLSKEQGNLRAVIG